VLTDSSTSAAVIGSVETLSNWDLQFDGAMSISSAPSLSYRPVL
jgi:hypothetical protein